MKPVLYFYLGVMLLLVPSAADCRITSIIVATENWNDATNPDGSGLYWDILEEIYTPEGIKIRKINTTYDGSVRLLKTKKADALIGSYHNEIADGLYPKNHFAADVVDVVAKKGRVENWAGEKTLKGRRAGWVKGYAYDNYLSVPVVKVEVFNRAAGLRILKNGRIDFYLDAAGDLEDFFKRHQALKQDYDIWFLKNLKLYIVFTKDERGRRLATIFDKRFDALLKTGKINDLYNYYITEKGANLTNPFNPEKVTTGLKISTPEPKSKQGKN